MAHDCADTTPWNPFDGLPGDLQATFQRAPLHALLVPTSYIAHEEAMSLFPHWMAAVAQAFSQWIGSWMAQDFPVFREWARGATPLGGAPELALGSSPA